MLQLTNCPEPVRGRAFFAPETGETRPIPCDRWRCTVCGPAKAYRLGLLAAAAEPERFITLSRAGPTPSEALRRLSVLSKSLRRAGLGFEYLAVLERHRNGFWHLHALQRGSYIPQRDLSRRASSAGMGSVVYIERVRGGCEELRKYLVKYLAKELDDLPPGTRRYSTSQGFWPGGKAAVEKRVFGSPREDAGGGSWSVLRVAGDWHKHGG